MKDVVFIALLVLAIPAWAAGLVCIVRGNRSFYRWYRPLRDARILPPGGRGPSVETWVRLLGRAPEAEPVAERLRQEAKHWFLRFFAFAAWFSGCIALAFAVNAL
jgi:hypothetical protein